MPYNINDFISELDSYFAKEDLNGAEKCLVSWKEKFETANSRNNLLSVLNEMVGYYRQTKEEDKGTAAINEAAALLSELNQESSVSGATILLNIATTLKSFGKAREAMPYYFRSEQILTGRLKTDDPLLAGLYNNLGLAYQDLTNYPEAEKCFLKALKISEADRKTALENAVTCVNLAHLKFDMDPFNTESTPLMEKAAAILKNPEYEGYARYAFTCRKCAPSFGYFGMFCDEKYLNEKADKIYAGT